MKMRPPPRRISASPQSATGRRPVRVYTGRPEQPTVVRHPSTAIPWKILLGFAVGAAALGFMGSSKMFESGLRFSSASSYAQRYEVRSVNLQSDGVFKGRARWTVTARIMNSTRESIPGPRLRVRLVRADNSVAAEGYVDYGGRRLGELSGVSLSYQMETHSAETLQAEVVVVPPREGSN